MGCHHERALTLAHVHPQCARPAARLQDPDIDVRQSAIFGDIACSPARVVLLHLCCLGVGVCVEHNAGNAQFAANIPGLCRARMLCASVRNLMTRWGVCTQRPWRAA